VAIIGVGVGRIVSQPETKAAAHASKRRQVVFIESFEWFSLVTTLIKRRRRVKKKGGIEPERENASGTSCHSSFVPEIIPAVHFAA
jgi:hypothetical protein